LPGHVTSGRSVSNLLLRVDAARTWCDYTLTRRYDVHRNLHQGKVGVLCLAPEEGLGVRDQEKRAQHVDAINRFRNI
jgi:hypothetical protein